MTESAANTLTFAEIQTAISIFEKVAWVISRIEWFLAAAQLQQMADNGDIAQCAVTASNQITALALNNPSVIDLLEIARFQASAVGYNWWQLPIIRDFSNLPGGGIIVAPRPLYLALKGTTAAAAMTVSARIYFTQMELKADEYLELIDFYRIVQ